MRIALGELRCRPRRERTETALGAKTTSLLPPARDVGPATTGSLKPHAHRFEALVKIEDRLRRLQQGAVSFDVDHDAIVRSVLSVRGGSLAEGASEDDRVRQRRSVCEHGHRARADFGHREVRVAHVVGRASVAPWPRLAHDPATSTTVAHFDLFVGAYPHPF